jgi:hypothetical protein
MLKISIVESPRRRQLVVEGKLIEPWAAERTRAWEIANADLNGRDLIVDLRSLTAVGPEGENVLLHLMRERVKLRCGLFIKELIRGLRRRLSTSD